MPDESDIRIADGLGWGNSLRTPRLFSAPSAF